MQRIGQGYYSPSQIKFRLRKARTHGNAKRVAKLLTLLGKVEALPDPPKLTKGWRSQRARKNRRRDMLKLRRKMTLKEIGDLYELTRERVRQILSNGA